MKKSTAFLIITCLCQFDNGGLPSGDYYLINLFCVVLYFSARPLAIATKASNFVTFSPLSITLTSAYQHRIFGLYPSVPVHLTVLTGVHPSLPPSSFFYLLQKYWLSWQCLESFLHLFIPFSLAILRWFFVCWFFMRR